KDGKIVPVKTDQLKIGDYLVVPKRGWNNEEYLTELNIVEEAMNLPENITKNLRLFGVRRLLSKLENKIKAFLPKNKYYRFNDFKKCDSIEFNLVRKLKPEDVRLFYTCKIGLKQSRYKLPV